MLGERIDESRAEAYGSIDGRPWSERLRGPRAALIAFILLTVGQAMWLLMGPGAESWVTKDEWRQIARPWTFDGLFSDYNSHLSLVPIVMYKALFSITGFSPYWPYRAIAVGGTACVAALVRMFMRRGDIRPWTATACAGVLLFVQGESIMVSQFQMTLALAFGLCAAVLATLPPSAVRAGLAAVSCMAALASSGVGVPVVLAAVVIAWRRAGAGTATAMALPSFLFYGAWWLTFSPGIPDLPREPAAIWLATALWQLPLALAGSWWSAVVLVVTLVTGVYLARRLPKTETIFEPSVLGLTAILLLGLTYLGRGLWHPTGGMFARFLFLCTALVLPLLAWCVQRTVTARPALVVPIALSLVLGAAVNVIGWRSHAQLLQSASTSNKLSTAALLDSPAGRAAPDWVVPGALAGMGSGTGEARWGLLRQFTPELIGVDGLTVPAEYANRAELLLRLAATGRGVPATMSCADSTSPVSARLRTGQRFGLEGGSAIIGRTPVSVSLVLDDGPQPLPAVFELGDRGREIEVVGRPGEALSVQFAATEPGVSFRLCR